MKNMRCRSCKQERNEPLSYWDRLKVWVLQHLHEELNDEKADAFTSGFGDGYKKGFEEAESRAKEREIFVAKFESRKKEIPLDCLISLDSVLDIRGNKQAGLIKVFLGGRELEMDEIGELKNEADLFQRSRLWFLMQETLKQKAIEQSVLNSTSWEECLSGKMTLHALGLLKAMIDSLLKVELKNYEK